MDKFGNVEVGLGVIGVGVGVKAESESIEWLSNES